MVTARDSRTQQPLDGEVRVNDVVVARTGQKFTHTFKLTLPPQSRKSGRQRVDRNSGANSSRRHSPGKGLSSRPGRH